MDRQGREHHYQADYTFNGRMYHVRYDDFDEFKQGCANLEDFLDLGNLNEISTGKMVAQSTGLVCKQCSLPVGDERQITWNGKPFWVRDCSSGEKHKTGYFRKAS